MILQREAMSDRIKQFLVERILDGTYKPGTRLVELQIARELNTSQAPVREALRELEAMRLVECEPYRGTRVRLISLRELQESYQVRGELEVLAAKLAAPRFQEDSKKLLTIHTDYQAATNAKNVDKFTHYNTKFHRLIVETSENEVLLRVWDSLTFETWTRLNLQRFSAQSFDWNSSLAEHEAIIEALVQGEGEKAGDLLRQHAQNAISKNGN